MKSLEHFESAERHLLAAQTTAGRESAKDPEMDQAEIAELVVADVLFAIAHGLMARTALDMERKIGAGVFSDDAPKRDREVEQWAWALGVEDDDD